MKHELPVEPVRRIQGRDFARDRIEDFHRQDDLAAAIIVIGCMSFGVWALAKWWLG